VGFFYVDSPFEDITNFEFSLALPASNVPTEKTAMTARARVVRIEPGMKRPIGTLTRNRAASRAKPQTIKRVLE